LQRREKVIDVLAVFNVLSIPGGPGREMALFVSAIVLAAGQGKRMGAQKLLLPVAGRTIIERVADAALASKANEVIAVLGSQAEEVAKVLAGKPVRYHGFRYLFSSCSALLLAMTPAGKVPFPDYGGIPCPLEFLCDQAKRPVPTPQPLGQVLLRCRKKPYNVLYSDNFS